MSDRCCRHLAARAGARGCAGAGDVAAAGSVGRLITSPLYLAGIALDGVGFLCIVAALHWLPLFLVQCASASSVGVTAVVGRRLLGTVLGRRSVVALAGLGVGLVLLASGAKPEAAIVAAASGAVVAGRRRGPVLAGRAVALRPQRRLDPGGSRSPSSPA